MKFKELNIKSEILKAIEEMGFVNATEVQQKATPHALQGSDLFVRSETGSGKTLAFGISLVNNLLDVKGVQSLVICPTRELAIQVAKELEKLTQFIFPESVAAIFGGADMGRQIKTLKNPLTKIVVGTPGRIIDHIERKSLKLHTIKTVVLDEADEMLDMGFKQDIEKILKGMQKLRQTMLFSATYPENIKQLTNQFLKNPIKIEIGIENQSLSNITQEFAIVKKQNKKEAVLKILTERNPYLSIVFCNTKAMSASVATFLSKNKISAKSLHGDMSQFERTRVMREVREGKIAVLVATDVASRGIDIKDVDYVINFDMPQTLEFFLHRIGRTARAGKEGRAITLISTQDELDMLKIVEEKTNSEIEKADLKELNFYFYNTPKKAQKPKFENTFKSNASPKQTYAQKKAQKISQRFGGVSERISEYEKMEKSSSIKKSKYASKNSKTNYKTKKGK